MKDNYRVKDLRLPNRPNTSISWRQKLGKLGENYVANLLSQNGWQVIERNWRAGRYAEIDIIAYDPGKTLVFIEVKTRIKATSRLGFDNAGFDKLDKRKMQKILGCARLYITQCKSMSMANYQGYRFDAFVLYYEPFQQADLIDTISKAKLVNPEVQHIKSFLP